MEIKSLFGASKKLTNGLKGLFAGLGAGKGKGEHIAAPTLADIGGGGGAVSSSLKEASQADVTGGDAAKQSKATADHIRGQWQQDRQASDARVRQAIATTERGAQINSVMAERGGASPTPPGAGSAAASLALGQRISSALAAKPAAAAPSKSGGLGMGQ